MNQTIYPIHERFASFQGEGVHMGRSAFFIRMFGCPIRCPWCDSAGTWHKDWIPPQIDKIFADQLAREAEDSNCSYVVITGGEPAVQDLTTLVSHLHAFGLEVAIETSGAFPIRGRFDWVTVSPKRWKLPVAETMLRANEFKLIIEEKADIEFYWAEILNHLGGSKDVLEKKPIWLHPEWSKREDPVVLGAIVDAVKGNCYFRAGWQLHKLYRADARDARSQSVVPLGGDLRKGY